MQKNLKKGFRKFLKFGLGALLGFTTLNSAGIIGTYFYNRSVSPEANTVVLSSASRIGEDTLLTSIGTKASDFFMYVPITLRQNLNGNRVDWYSNPDKFESILALGRNEYGNVVLIGHGKETEYVTKSGVILAKDLRVYGAIDKPGFLLQHTCGGGEGERLRDVMLKDPERGYSFKEEMVSRGENYFLAVKELIFPSYFNSGIMEE